MIIAKNICLGLVAAILAKPDICIDHLLKAIIDCQDSGYSKLVCHLVRLLFPFGLESWYMIQRLSESDRKSTSSMTDQYFCNIMAFYYRAIVTEYLASEKSKTKHGLEESPQHSIGNDAGECSSANTMESNNRVLSMDDTFTSCNEGTNSENPERPQSTEYSLESSNVQSVSEVDFGSNTTKDRAEGENNNVSKKLEETSIYREIYRIGLVCSTVLLSDIHAQYQKLNSNIKHYVPEKDEHLQDGEDSGIKSELEISLSVRKTYE